MSTSNLYLRVTILCYAILSLPYIALASDLRLGVPQHNRAEPPLATANDIFELQSATYRLRNVDVNSSTVAYNIPEDQREVFYFRNFTLVGKKSEGFDIDQWDQENGRLMKRSADEEAADGDSALTKVAAGVVASGAVVAACILLAPGCGTYIGSNIGKFIKAIGDAGGQAAVDVVQTAAGSNPGLPRNGTIQNMKDLDATTRMVTVALASMKPAQTLLSKAFLTLTVREQTHLYGLAGKQAALQRERCLGITPIALVQMLRI